MIIYQILQLLITLLLWGSIAMILFFTTIRLVDYATQKCILTNKRIIVMMHLTVISAGHMQIQDIKVQTLPGIASVLNIGHIYIRTPEFGPDIIVPYVHNPKAFKNKIDWQRNYNNWLEDRITKAAYSA